VITFSVLLLLLGRVSVQEGVRSTVHLVEVARLPPSDRQGMEPPVKDGIRLVFVAIRKSGFPGLATLTETRSFEVDGRPYPAPGHPRSEPETVLYDLAKFRQTIRPDLRDNLPDAPAADSMVIVVSIGGAELSAGARARVKLSWGWNDVTEDFWFDFEVPT
jgi:hypothetical protein